MEGAHFINHGELVSLSEQQFIDCVTDANGCKGGDEVDAFFYSVRREGPAVALEGDYPYTGVEGTCKDSEGGKVKVENVKTI
jgi:cathepsin L